MSARFGLRVSTILCRRFRRRVFSKGWTWFPSRFPSLGMWTCLLAWGVAWGSGCRPKPDPASPPLTVEVLASADRIRIGDPVRVDLVAEHPEDAVLQIAAPIPDTLAVLNRDRFSRSLRSGRMRTTFRYDLTSFVLGSHTALVGRVTAARRGGTPPLEIAVTGIVLRVESSLVASGQDPATEAWRALPGLERGPRNRGFALFWILPLIALVALAFGWLARRLGRPKKEPEKTPLAAHEIALRELEQLRNESWIDREVFYVKLSTIVRRYLEARFDLHAPERTTEEFIRDATFSSRLTAEQQQGTQSFLEQSDLVKFARWLPGIEEMKGAFAAAERLVRETIPAPVADAPHREGGA